MSVIPSLEKSNNPLVLKSNNSTFGIILLCLSVSSCGSLLNTFYDEHQTFIDTRNKEIGDNVDQVLRYSGRMQEQYYMDIELIDETILEYRFDTPWCAWSYYVNKHTQEIQSWKFLTDDTSGCRYKKFYEGPW